MTNVHRLSATCAHRSTRRGSRRCRTSLRSATWLREVFSFIPRAMHLLRRSRRRFVGLPTRPSEADSPMTRFARSASFFLLVPSRANRASRALTSISIRRRPPTLKWPALRRSLSAPPFELLFHQTRSRWSRLRRPCFCTGSTTASLDSCSPASLATLRGTSWRSLRRTITRRPQISQP